MKCHQKNSPILHSEGGGTLYAAGWNRGAEIKDGMVVIDLTGTQASIAPRDITTIEALDAYASAIFHNTLAMRKDYYKPHAQPKAWLRAKITDFQAPAWGRDIWESLAHEIQSTLDAGTDVMVACLGGHGRTGLAISILAYLMGAIPEDQDPILWTRAKHCENAVENNTQIRYIYDILDLEDTGIVQGAKSYTTETQSKLSTKGGDASPKGLIGVPILRTFWNEFQNYYLKEAQND